MCGHRPSSSSYVCERFRGPGLGRRPGRLRSAEALTAGHPRPGHGGEHEDNGRAERTVPRYSRAVPTSRKVSTVPVPGPGRRSPVAGRPPDHTPRAHVQHPRGTPRPRVGRPAVTVTMGRRTFDSADGSHGWRGDRGYGYEQDRSQPPPDSAVTQRAPRRRRHTVGFTFVTDGIASAVSQASKAAGNKEVVIMGGADVAGQALVMEAVHELRVHLSPVLVGAGTRLFDHVTEQAPAHTAGRRRHALRDASDVPRRPRLRPADPHHGEGRALRGRAPRSADGGGRPAPPVRRRTSPAVRSSVRRDDDGTRGRGRRGRRAASPHRRRSGVR
jgi:dihydrofolate reductase